MGERGVIKGIPRKNRGITCLKLKGNKLRNSGIYYVILSSKNTQETKKRKTDDDKYKDWYQSTSGLNIVKTIKTNCKTIHNPHRNIAVKSYMSISYINFC